MARNLDDFIDTTEHGAIDHTGAPLNLLDSTGHGLIDHTGAPLNLLDSSGHSGINHNGITGVGKILQRVRTTIFTTTSTTASIPLDTSVPTTSEGAALTSLSITPLNASSKIWVRALIVIGTLNANPAMFLYKNGDGSARVVAPIGTSTSGSYYIAIPLEYEHSGFGSTATQTWFLRYGTNSGTIYVNTFNGTNYYGTTPQSWLEAIEIAP